MGNDLTFDPIFLGGEGEGDIGSRAKLGFSGCKPIEFVVTNVELDIADGKRRVVRVVSMFSRATQEEEGNADHVGHTLESAVGAGDQVGCGDDRFHHLDGNRLDPLWWRIFLGVRSELSTQSEVEFSMVVEADVRGPQHSVRLTDVS